MSLSSLLKHYLQPMATRKFCSLLLTVLFLCSSRIISFSYGSNTISTATSLSGNQTITSANGAFELGFFKPGTSSNYYIGIWYKTISELTVVWVANRDRPLSDKNSRLQISNGNLVLSLPSSNGSETIIWSTGLNSTNSSFTEAVLLDNGNFVLRDGPNTSQTVIWETFDHPTNTWLPGAKLGLSKITNKTQLLTSWKNLNDPGTGIFSLEHDPAGIPQYLIVWNMLKMYWTSGEWNGMFFSNVPEMRSNYMYNAIQFNFSYVTNENESYFTYGYLNSSIKSMFIIDLTGQIKQLSWLDNAQKWYLFWTQPQQQCAVYALCGPFGVCNEKTDNFCDCLPGFTPSSQLDWNLSDWSMGCKRNANLRCGNSTSKGNRDKFVPRPNMRLPVNPKSVPVGSLGECELECLNNCSCVAYAYESNRCSVWHGDLLHLQQLTQDDTRGKTLFIRLAASEFPDHKHGKGKVVGIVLGSAAGVLALLGLLLVLNLKWRRGSRRPAKAVEGSLMRYGYRDLQTVTKNFSEKLGGGGFGSVFKGTLPDSTVIAVKKLEGKMQGEKQFRTEVSTIGTIQHVNLIRLRGFCSEGINRLLVYDYMPNGSLDAHLFHQNSSGVLDWNTRYQIALGTARGLVYLHEKCRDCIIHCDIKPENILLDNDLSPKVADFGLAKLVGRDFSRVLTTIRGTRGYLAPEWISGVAITAKADVYSYGMMLFEFISGRRNSELSEDGMIKFFPSWAASQMWEGAEALSLLDHRLEGKANEVELTKVARVACWCAQDDETNRPTMSQVVQVLEGVTDVELAPIPRSLQVFVRAQEDIVFFTESSSNQSSQIRTGSSAASSQTKSITGSESCQTPSQNS